MIGKEHFLAQMQKLEAIFGECLSTEKLQAYYEVMSPDFTDQQFDVALNIALKNSFKFPPIAAFYKGVEMVEAPKVYDPVTPEEAKILEATRRMVYGEDA